MTSAEIRQSFLDFFKSKGHTIVPSSSLMPDSPNLLFTNAGMNQFVPIFLGQRGPDVSKWPGALPGSDTRAADTQKCIRAGGKHNDLEDVGLDTYHHTFFEMLGNWSFGDYFKKDAIAWAWELITQVWKFPPNRLYATVFSPHAEFDRPRWEKDLKSAVEFADHRVRDLGTTEFATGSREGAGALNYSDLDAASFWAEHFIKAGLDPFVHIVPGNQQDNFWMMGDTGPCGPCSEIHVDLTPQGDTRGRLVNQASAECIEIWNLVFIQFNAEPDGPDEESKMKAGGKAGVDWRQRFIPLPARHVDTGMGFERVSSIIQNTKGFTDFNRVISNYETDVFRPLFDRIERLSGKKYGSTLPAAGTTGTTEQEKVDVAFRVIADHIRTLSFAIADGIEPGNKVRNAVVRRVLRRAAMFGRSLGFHEPFLYKLVSVLEESSRHVFPEIRARRDHIEAVIQREEEAFNETLDSGIAHFSLIIDFMESLDERIRRLKAANGIEGVRDLLGRQGPYSATRFESIGANDTQKELASTLDEIARTGSSSLVPKAQELHDHLRGIFSGRAAFLLAATYGLPIEEVQRLARERGLSVDMQAFELLNKEHKEISKAGHVKQVIELSQVETSRATEFVGYDKLESRAKILEIVGVKEQIAVVLDMSPFYAEMGGQVGDTGELAVGGQLWRIYNTQKAGDAWLHFISDSGNGDQVLNRQSEIVNPTPGSEVTLTVDRARRNAIQRHHTVTHLLHWALHDVVSKDAVQKGSFVGPEKLTFDFSSAALTAQQVADVERLVNERILENAPVTWTEVKYSHIKDRKDVMQFFGEKYGDWVRVVQIGGKPTALDGYSMELCGGTHTRATGELGLFRIVAESAIAAGIRRVEAISGLEAYKRAHDELQLIKTLSGKVNSPVGELEKKVESMLAQQKELEKQLKAMQQKQASELGRSLAGKSQNFGSTRAVIENLGSGDGDFLQSVADALKGEFKGVVVLGSAVNGAVALVATVSPELTKQVQAGKIIQTIAPIVGGKGGGRPDNARGGGKETGKLEEALAHARKLLQELK
jgi:alanyl-tRNA synthetase